MLLPSWQPSLCNRSSIFLSIIHLSIHCLSIHWSSINLLSIIHLSIFYCSVAQLYPTLCDRMDCSTPGFPVLHFCLYHSTLIYHLLFRCLPALVGKGTCLFFSFSKNSFPLWFITEYWIYLFVLYSRTLLFICSVYILLIFSNHWILNIYQRAWTQIFI